MWTPKSLMRSIAGHWSGCPVITLYGDDRDYCWCRKLQALEREQHTELDDAYRQTYDPDWDGPESFVD